MNIQSLCNIFLVIFSFMSGASHFCPMLCLHVVVVTLFALDFNNSGFRISAGSESYLVSDKIIFLFSVHLYMLQVNLFLRLICSNLGQFVST